MWLIINSNQLPVQELSDIDVLAKNIFSAFWDKDITSFASILHTVGNNKAQTQPFLTQLQQTTEFKRIHLYSRAKEAELKAWDLINKACNAAGEGNVDQLKYAIQNGAALNTLDLYHGQSVLDLMADSENPEILELLALTCEDPTHLSALLLHMTKKPIDRQITIFDLFIKKFKENKQYESNLNMVYEFIAASQQPVLLHLLITYKVNLNVLNKDGKSLLSTILDSGQTGFVRYYQLISHANNKVSRRKLAVSLKKYKGDIDSYLNSLNEKDRNESNTLLQQLEQREKYNKFCFFAKRHSREQILRELYRNKVRII